MDWSTTHMCLLVFYVLISQRSSRCKAGNRKMVELLAAKNLIGANMNGTSDPYAIITCGTEKRFRYGKRAQVKGHQNWVKLSGQYLTFPSGGTQFEHGALHHNQFHTTETSGSEC